MVEHIPSVKLTGCNVAEGAVVPDAAQDVVIR